MNKYLTSFLLINLFLIFKSNQSVNEISGMNHNQNNQAENKISEPVKTANYNSIIFFYKNKRKFQLIL